MAYSEEKPSGGVTHLETNDEPQTFHGKTNEVYSVALTDAVAKDNQSMLSSNMVKLYCIMVLVTLTSCMNGYDGSVMSSLNAMDPFHEYFNISMEGSSIGLVTALYSVGNIIGCFFASPASDIMGRRFGMSLGCTVIVVGTIIQATTKAIGGFMGGRLLVGLGVTLVTTSAPIYLIEIAYPTWRGIGSGLFNVCSWYIGSMTASWTTYGTGFMTSNWSWRIPVIIQAIPAAIAMGLVWLIPESPRWLIMHDRSEEARKILVKYHGNGREDSAVAQLECDEIQAQLRYARELSTGQKWYDYRIIVNSSEVRYRMFLVLLVTFFSQFIGGSISYYMPVVYENLGITSSSKQLLLNALSTVVGFVFGLAGSWTVESFGRRNLFLWGTFLTGLCYLVMNVFASLANGHISDSMGYGFIFMSFLYGAIFSFCWTPLQALYPTEVLRNDIRVKGMAAQGVLSNLGAFINMYATPVSLQNIGWKTYTIFLVIHFVEWAFMYFFLVETKGRSLEELDEIFTDPKPVKKSLEKKKVIVEGGVGVMSKVEDC